MNNLEWIDKQIEKYKCFYEEDKNYKEIQEGWGRLIVRFQQIKSELEAWEDKKTPKKPERFISKFHVSPPKCPVCKTIPHTCTQKYCDECGQKLDWSDEK